MYLTQDLTFVKSSYSTTAKECVEVAQLPQGAAVRDSTRPEKGHLAFDAQEWGAFVKEVRAGRL